MSKANFQAAYGSCLTQAASLLKETGILGIEVGNKVVTAYIVMAYIETSILGIGVGNNAVHTVAPLLLSIMLIMAYLCGNAWVFCGTITRVLL